MVKKFVFSVLFTTKLLTFLNKQMQKDEYSLSDITILPLNIEYWVLNIQTFLFRGNNIDENLVMNERKIILTIFLGS